MKLPEQRVFALNRGELISM